MIFVIRDCDEIVGYTEDEEFAESYARKTGTMYTEAKKIEDFPRYKMVKATCTPDGYITLDFEKWCGTSETNNVIGEMHVHPNKYVLSFCSMSPRSFLKEVFDNFKRWENEFGLELADQMFEHKYKVKVNRCNYGS